MRLTRFVCFLFLAGCLEPIKSADAQSSDYKGLWEAGIPFIEGAAFNAESPACSYTRSGTRLVVKRVVGARPEPTPAGTLDCPDVSEGGSGAWFQLMEKYSELDRRISARLEDATPLSPDEFGSVVDLKHRIGWGFACNFVRTGAGRKEAEDAFRFVYQNGSNAGREALAPVAANWMRMIGTIADYQAAPSLQAPSDCLPVVATSGEVVAGEEKADVVVPPLNPRRVATIVPETSTTDEASARGTAMLIPVDIWRAMRGKSWHGNLSCPSRARLALLQMPYRDFSDQRQIGQMIVAKDVAEEVLDAFADLYRGGFQIERMTLVHKFGGDDARSMAANNTSAFNCRAVTGGSRLSEHSYGRAIDINPVQNPYVRRGKVQPRAGRRFASGQQRARARQGMIRRGDVAVNAFKKIGWKWGGYWRSLKDYQHFSKNGR